MDRKYIPTIGIECHVQLKTRSKLFSRVGNDAREAEPNTTVSPICFGLPGVLPVLNEGAIELAVKAGLALNAEVAGFSRFDRKHYFYPDLPKGYQITQYDQPIIAEGYVDVPVNGENVRIGIERAHLEEDAGKSMHPQGADYTLVDLNRAGTPLLEIVSKPDINSPAAAKAYVRELYLLMKYAFVSDADLYHGHMRFDVNVSAAPEGEMGTRTEIKNLNSFRAVEKAAAYEFDRQVALLEEGKSITQETRGWDDMKQKTFSQRTKEEAHDYRYFPDPDLPPIEIDSSKVKAIEGKLGLLPQYWRRKLADFAIDERTIESLLDAETEDADISYLQPLAAESPDQQLAKQYANWVVNVLVPLQRETGRLSTDGSAMLRLIRQVHSLVNDNKLSSNNAYTLLRQLAVDDKPPSDIEGYAQQQGLLQLSDSNRIEVLVDEVIAANPKAASDVKQGEMKAVGFLVGQVMKASRGQADPQLTQKVIKQRLDA